MVKSECIFCKIISGESKGYIIYKNDYVCCFLDKFPINKGHILVVPKIHYEEFVDVDLRSLNEIINAAQKITKILEKIFKIDGITIMQNNGMFKCVDHYHMHIIPRFNDDGFSWIEPEFEPDEEYFQKLHNSFSHLLND